jgi:hypothetical protein
MKSCLGGVWRKGRRRNVGEEVEEVVTWVEDG